MPASHGGNVRYGLFPAGVCSWTLLPALRRGKIILATSYVNDGLGVESIRPQQQNRGVSSCKPTGSLFSFESDVRSHFKLKTKSLTGEGTLILGMLMQWSDSGSTKLSVAHKIDQTPKTIRMKNANIAKVPML